MKYWLKDEDGNQYPLDFNYNNNCRCVITCTNYITNMYYNDREQYNSLRKLSKRILRKERIKMYITWKPVKLLRLRKKIKKVIKKLLTRLPNV